MEETLQFTRVDRHRYIALTTFRKNGTPVMTPVWFVKRGRNLVIWTALDSGKAKRIRKNPSVQVGPSNFQGKLLGKVEQGLARLIQSGSEAELEKAFLSKYGWQLKLFAFLARRGGGQHTYIEISPCDSTSVTQVHW
jgi:uncharacterized protein